MDYKMSMKVLAVVLISMLFLFSGIHKIFNFSETANDFHNKINSGILSNVLTFNASQVLIIGAILILMIAPILMTIGIYLNNNLLLRIGTWLLIGFVIVATFIYHPITDGTQINDMLKNFAIVGGLIMISIQASELN
jgi:uncharacterized membrane protein YphA (DoxX/SURF4 family)